MKRRGPLGWLTVLLDTLLVIAIAALIMFLLTLACGCRVSRPANFPRIFPRANGPIQTPPRGDFRPPSGST